MAENSAISWTHHTFNPWRGCEHATDEHGNEHPGCAHCYAEAMAKRNPKVLGQWGAEGTRVKAADAYWQLPIKWNREAQSAGERRRVFCASISDVFEDWHGPVFDHHGHCLLHCGRCSHTWQEPAAEPELCPKCRWSAHGLHLDDLRRDLFALIDQTPWLDWLLLTKRPESVRRMWPAKNVATQTTSTCVEYHWTDGATRANAWLGTSVSDQATADKWGRELTKLRDLVPVLFLSAEPLLGHVAPLLCQVVDGCVQRAIDWVIVGGESGPHHRPCDPAWIESIVRQCREAGVSCYVKQDAGPRPGMQGRLPEEVWTVKEFPSVGARV